MRARSIYLYLLAVSIMVLLASCGGSGKVKNGMTLYEEKNYTLAIPQLKNEYKEQQVPLLRGEKAFYVAESYRLSGNTKDAEGWYAEAIKQGYDAIATYNYAITLKANEKYKLAIEQFTNFARLEPFSKEKAFEQIKSCNLALKWIKERVTLDLQNLTAINSNGSEYAPVVLPSGDLVFTSDRIDATGNDTYGWTGEKYSDLYLTKKQTNGSFSGVVNYSPELNSGVNEGTITFSRDGNEVYFTRCGSQGKDKDDYCAIFVSRLQSLGGWSSPEKIKLFDADTFNVGHPFLSKDGKYLLFAAEAPGGYGGKDLYITFLQAGTWTSPKNLGVDINTPGNEVFPFIDETGTLYFSSDGHDGLGGLDIFSAPASGGVWSKPENLKIPINSGADDYGLWLTKAKPKDANDPVRMSGFFSSNRPGGAGKDDIYMFQLSNENLFVLEGVILEKIFADPSDPNSKVIDFQPVNEANITVKKYGPGFPIVTNISSDKFGRFGCDLVKESDYYVSGEKEGFLKQSANFSTKGLRDLKNITIPVKVRLIVERIYQDREIVIPNIYYDYDKTTLRPESFPVLDTLYSLFAENPTIVVEIGAHTDSRGSTEYNIILSQGRAASVVKYLVSKGIPAQRLKAVGYGESKPINKCVDGVECTEEEYQLNRRTTFKILSETFNLESITPEDIRIDPKKP
jgi:peptidoglycan-associated lipoprotein